MSLRLRLGLRLGVLVEVSAVAMYRAEARALGDGALGRLIHDFAGHEDAHARGLRDLLGRCGGRPFPGFVQRIGAALTATAGVILARSRPKTLLGANRMVERWGLALYAWTLRHSRATGFCGPPLREMLRQEREHALLFQGLLDESS